MAPLWLNETDVEKLLTMEAAIEAEEQAFRQMAAGNAQNPPRHRLQAGGLMMRVMSASVRGMGLGLKTYTGFGRGSRFVTLLWDEASGALQAVIESRRLTQIRTGAATGLATRHMANPTASQVGVLGSGWQARAQLEAVCRVRPVNRVRVYSRTQAHRREFALEMRRHLGVEVQAVKDAREAVEAAEILIAITTADRPLFQADWLQEGVHINAAGRHVGEIDLETVRRSAVVAVDDLAQAQEEAGDLIAAIERGYLQWDSVTGLAQIVAGVADGRRRAEDVSLFVSLGVAIEDVAVARVVYEEARRLRVGQELPESTLG